MIEILRFTGEWCSPCRMMNPIFIQLAQEHPEVTITTIDIDKEPDIAKAYSVKSIPTIMFRKDGVMRDKQVGAVPKAVLENKLKALQ